MREIYHSSLDHLMEEVFEDIVVRLHSLLDQEHIYIGLSGGRSLVGLYRLFGHKFETLPKKLVSKLVFFLLDERKVARNNSERNGKGIRDVFFQDLVDRHIMNSKQFLEPDFSTVDAHLKYATLIPRIDLSLVGVGEDGHIASLFPNHQGLDAQEHFFSIDDAPKLPPERISVSASFVYQSRFVYVFFIGKSKESAYMQFSSTDHSTPTLPVSLFSQHPNVCCIRDF